MIINKYVVKEFLERDGINPFRDWLDTMPTQIRYRIQVRIWRLEAGNLGDYKSVGHGVFELRLHFRSGVRIYFAFKGRNLILLLGGGDKSSQRKDITKARMRWLDYKKEQ